jgi:hypothetical protein
VANGCSDAEHASFRPPPTATISTPLKQTESHMRDSTAPKDVKNEDRSHDVDENKGRGDKISRKKSDIGGN